MKKITRIMLWSLCVVVLTTGCHRKQMERERQTAQLQTISKRLDEIQANLAVMSEAKTETIYTPAPAPAPAPAVTLNPDNASVVQITDFTKAEPVSRKQQVSRLGQRAPQSRNARNSRSHGRRASKYSHTIAVSGLSAIDVQKALKNAGFNPGKVDGKIGPNTINAIKKFQSAEGLKADGVVGRNTWNKLSPHLSGAGKAAPAKAEAAPTIDANTFNVF